MLTCKFINKETGEVVKLDYVIRLSLKDEVYFVAFSDDRLPVFLESEFYTFVSIM